MGRTRVFDLDTVVRAARTVFWRHGYEGASLPDLEAATGLNRSSIYHAFGSKRGLFDAAVQSYLAEIVRPRLVGLTTVPVPRDALEGYLRALRTALAEPDSFASAHGCLLLNTAGAPLAADAAVSATISAYRDELHSAFRGGVAALVPNLDERERERLTLGCTSAVVAALLLARVNRDAAVASLDAALDTLSVAARARAFSSPAVSDGSES